ncbi:hypothetical protein SBRCBS47491_001131 [Sporothrix bragantina]|uniref:Uncharacterized protein n=1 Tax=Sporothrix bragantina TaxID=671064 RepID=A0ABP0AVZ6_9PEZI
MTAALPQQTAPDDIGSTFIINTPDSHTEKHQRLGSQLSPSPNKMDNNNNTSQTQTQAAPAAAPLTSASSPSLSLLPPPLPQRDARRNSYVLDALLTSKTNKAADTTITNVASVAGPPTPHDVYLSSEEDASSMGDLSDLDLSDFDFDDELENPDDNDIFGNCTVELARTASIIVRTNSTSSASLPHDKVTTTSTSTSSQTHTRRHSHDTARVVSVVFAGKPSLVDLGVERAARRRSINSRTSTSSSSSSSLELAETRPSTSSGSVLSTAPSSTVSPVKQHKRNSSSSSMLASFKARKLALTAAAVNATANTATLGRSLAPVLTSLDTSMPSPPSPTSESAAAPSASTYTTTASPVVAAPTRSFTTSVLMPPPSSTSAASSPRTPTFGYGTSNLLRGMTRSLTLSGRRGLGRRDSAVVDKTDISPVSPAMPPTLPRADTVSSLMASEQINNNAGNRKSLAMSVVSAMTSMTAPPPGPPSEEEAQFEYDAASVSTMPRRLAMPPASVVVSKKNTGSSFLGNLTGRRRSMKLL